MGNYLQGFFVDLRGWLFSVRILKSLLGESPQWAVPELQDDQIYLRCKHTGNLLNDGSCGLLISGRNMLAMASLSYQSHGKSTQSSTSTCWNDIEG